MKMKFIKIFNASGLIRKLIGPILLLILSSSGNAQYENYNHPELKWQTIETEHFLVHFHNGTDRTARLIAKIAEEVYSPITKSYHFEPDEKVHFIVRDHDDYSNGAAYYYDNKIEVWATPLDFILRGTNNWLRDVVSHEFTHMIQLQAARKMPRWLPSIYLQNIAYEEEKRDDVLYGFPKRIISYPLAGTIMPMWLAEGTAQYGSYKNGNDSWDAHRDMIVRIRALNEGIYSLDEMGVFGKSSIGNESVYNHGFSFVLYLADRFGPEILEKITRNMSSPLTFNVSGAIKKATGVSAKKLHEEWKTGLELSYLKRSDIIRKNLVQGTLLDEKGAANIYPAWSPVDDRFAYLSNDRSDYISYTSLFIQKNDGSKRKQIKPGVVSPPSWSPNGNKVIYSREKKNENNSHFYELFLYDLESEKEKQLTFSGRASYPVLAPDGKTVYFASGSDGGYNLFSLDISNGTKKKITNFSSGEEVFNSTVFPDGKRIVFAMNSEYGRDIAIINSDGSGFRYLLKSKFDERDPAFSMDGSRIYFSSDKTGIYNIYEYDFSTEMSRPVTNVLGGAFMPSMNEGGQLLYSLYTVGGYKLALINEIKYVDPEFMEYDPEFGSKIPAVDYDDSKAPEYEPRKYTFQYRTTFFLPRLMYDYGKPKVGFYSFSSDALDKYSIFGGAAMSRDLDRDMFVLLDFRKFRQTLFLEMYNLTRHESFYSPPDGEWPAGTNEITFGYWEIDLGARQKLSETQEYEVRGLISRQSANFKPVFEGITFKPIYYDYYRGINFVFKWQYNNIMPRYDREINPSYGRRIILEYWRNSDKVFEDFSFTQSGTLTEVYKNYSYNKLTADWREYIGLPFLIDRSALTLRFQGGYIDRKVDDFLHFFGGGLTGLKAYSYYSIEGRNMAVGTVTYRFPLKKKIAKNFGPWYFDRLYGSITYQVGDAWSGKKFKWSQLKRGVDLELRMDMYSFYGFPTKVGFTAAYGLDEIRFADYNEGKKWKYFLTVLFGYDIF